MAAMTSDEQAFQEQLRGVLDNVISEASGEVAYEQRACLRDLHEMLKRVPQEVVFRASDYPFLQCATGQFLRTVCGFEERKSSTGAVLFSLPKGTVRGAVIAQTIVGSYLEGFSYDGKNKPVSHPPKSTPQVDTASGKGAPVSKIQDFLAPAAGSSRLELQAQREAETFGGAVCMLSGEGLQVHADSDSCAATKKSTPTMSQDHVAVMYVHRVVLRAVRHLDEGVVDPADLFMPPEEVAMSVALEESLTGRHAERMRRPGMHLSLPQMTELGAVFERQTDGTDTCAVHSLNNLVQPQRAAEDAATLMAATVAKMAAAEQGEDVLLQSGGPLGPFDIKTLQAAEAECQFRESDVGFLPTSPHLPSLRWGTEDDKEGSPQSRTGMFDVEAVKIAARKKGYEVIDIEPKTQWNEAECARYVTAAQSLRQGTNCRRWFLGFLVYERIPGKPMHYYSIVHWPQQVSSAEKDSEDRWIVLDSLDRGGRSPRNRLLDIDDVVKHYDENSEWFKSWLVRWYPVVDRCAAIDTLRNCLTSHVHNVCGREMEAGVGPLGISMERAKIVLDSKHIRWNVALATEELLGAVEDVSHELLVLRLAVNEQQARLRLESACWDFATAVRSQADSTLEQHGLEMELSSTKDSRAICLALQLVQWNVRMAAQLLLLAARMRASMSEEATCGRDTSVSSPPMCMQEAFSDPSSLATFAARLRSALGALEACSWDVDHAFTVIRMLHMERTKTEQGPSEGKNATPPLTEGDCVAVLECVDYDLQRTRALLEVWRSLPSAPISVCAEALRRSNGHPPDAHALLSEFLTRVQSIVASVGCTGPDHIETGFRSPEIAEVARLAMEASDWNPAIAFWTAENFAVGILQMRQLLLEKAHHAQAQWRNLRSEEGSSSKAFWGMTVPSSLMSSSSAKPEVTWAKAKADNQAAELFRQSSPNITLYFEVLETSSMNPQIAVSRIWQSYVTRVNEKAPDRSSMQAHVTDMSKVRRPSRSSRDKSKDCNTM